MAPTFRHGVGTRILANQYNFGGILQDSGADASVELSETTVYGQNDKTFMAGQLDHKVTYKGLYDGAYSTAALPRSRVQEVIQAALGSTSAVVNTYGPEGDTIGRRAKLFAGLPDTYKTSSPVTDVVKIEASQVMQSDLSNGEWLVAFSAAATASTYATVDHGKLSTGGGAVHAHVVSYTSTGVWTWRVQHSSNGSAFTNLTTARNLNAATLYTRVTTTGTVKRYVKAVISSVTGGSAPLIGIAYGRNYV